MDSRYSPLRTHVNSDDEDQVHYSCAPSREDQPLLFGRSSPTQRMGAPDKKIPIEEEPMPRRKMTRSQLLVVISILVTELCERLTYYSVVANMVLFCESILDFESDEASVVTLVFAGTVYIIPVFGGMVSDSLAGQYNTIFGSGLLYVLGLFLLPASAVDYRKWFGGEEDLTLETRKIYFFLGLVFIAFGTGGIKANVGPFGARQVEEYGPDAVQSFFNWFYWFINAGAIVAYSGVAYVQQEIGFDYGFLIPLISMILALLVFLMSKGKYKHAPPEGSIVKTSCLVCCQSCNGCNNPSWDNARRQNGGSYDNEMVDGVISVMRVLPVFVIVIIYWAVYSQMSTSLFLQSERMNISVGDVKLPAAMLNIFNTLIILILIPIMDLLVYPALERCGRRLSHLQRIGIGIFLVSLSMVYAGILEIVRKDNIKEYGAITQTLGKEEYQASKLSMFAQIPEFAFIGSSEVFASISGLEFAYTQSPKFMQGLIMGLFLMTSGIGSYVASLVVAIVKSWRTSDASDWFPEEPNNGHLEYMFFLLAGLAILSLLVFIVVARWYKYRPTTPIEETAVRPDDVDVNGLDLSHPEYATDNPAYVPYDEKKAPMPLESTKL